MIRNKKRIYICFVIIAICLFMICLSSCQEMNAVDEPIERYEVVSVHIYQRPVTTGMGGVRNVEIKYYFSYIDNEGHLNHVDNFDHSQKYEYVELGDKNEYVINPNDDTKVLYLTKETMEKLNQIGD